MSTQPLSGTRNWSRRSEGDDVILIISPIERLLVYKLRAGNMYGVQFVFPLKTRSPWLFFLSPPHPISLPFIFTRWLSATKKPGHLCFLGKKFAGTKGLKSGLSRETWTSGTPTYIQYVRRQERLLFTGLRICLPPVIIPCTVKKNYNDQMPRSLMRPKNCNDHRIPMSA